MSRPRGNAPRHLKMVACVATVNRRQNARFTKVHDVLHRRASNIGKVQGLYPETRAERLIPRFRRIIRPPRRASPITERNKARGNQICTEVLAPIPPSYGSPEPRWTALPQPISRFEGRAPPIEPESAMAADRRREWDFFIKPVRIQEKGRPPQGTPQMNTEPGKGRFGTRNGQSIPLVAILIKRCVECRRGPTSSITRARSCSRRNKGRKGRTSKLSSNKMERPRRDVAVARRRPEVEEPGRKALAKTRRR